MRARAGTSVETMAALVASPQSTAVARSAKLTTRVVFSGFTTNAKRPGSAFPRA